MPGHRKHRTLVRSGAQWTTVPHLGQGPQLHHFVGTVGLSLCPLGICKLLTGSNAVGLGFYR